MATSTKWGRSQRVTHIARGIRSVATAGHGGVLLSPGRNALVPSYMRRADGAYEEDCDWAIPALVFEEEWRAWADSTSWTNGDSQIEAARNSLKSWHPDAWENFTETILKEGESYMRDKSQMELRTATMYVVTAAWGDWQPGVTKGMVGVVARTAHGDEKWFLVPAEEYRERKNFYVGKASCFVCNPEVHQEVGPFA